MGALIVDLSRWVWLYFRRLGTSSGVELVYVLNADGPTRPCSSSAKDCPGRQGQRTTGGVEEEMIGGRDDDNESEQRVCQHDPLTTVRSKRKYTVNAHHSDQPMCIDGKSGGRRGGCSD